MTSWLIVGLGNPGPTYAATRHNIGYLVADVLAADLGGKFKSVRAARADAVSGLIAGQRVVLGRSRHFMNESGIAVAGLLKFHDIPAENLIVIHDELDIEFGRLRVKFGGGDNGHNGLKSIRQSIGTGDFYRVRCGIGRPPGRMPVHDWVLKPFGATERKSLDVNVVEAADAIVSLMTHGLTATQSQFNS